MSTAVEFHTGVGDEVAYAARLLRKAHAVGARLLVRGPGPRLAQLDRLLWTQHEREFVPHLRWVGGSAAPPQAARTPIWLVEGEVPDAPPPVLVSLGAELPEDLDPFSRVIEVVGDAAEDVAAGRARWRQYLERGLAPKHVGQGS